MYDTLTILVAGLLILTSVAVLISSDWRLTIAALCLQYIGVVILVAQVWPVGLSAVKLLAGWMAAAVLGITKFSQPGTEDEAHLPSNRVFRFLAAGLVLLFIVSVTPKISDWFPQISAGILLGGLILISMGLLQVGMTSQPFRVILGLLTVLSGFEILYSAVELSVLVDGLLAAITLVFALVGSYLIGLPELDIDA